MKQSQQGKEAGRISQLVFAQSHRGVDGRAGGVGGKVSVRSAGRGVVGLKGVVLITRRWSGAAQVMILNTFVGATEGS